MGRKRKKGRVSSEMGKERWAVKRKRLRESLQIRPGSATEAALKASLVMIKAV